MITYEAKSGKCLEISFIISAGAKRDHESPLQNSSEADSERDRNPTLCDYVNKWNVNQNVSLVPRVEKAKSSQSFDYEFVIFILLFLWLDSSFCKVL